MASGYAGPFEELEARRDRTRTYLQTRLAGVEEAILDARSVRRPLGELGFLRLALQLVLADLDRDVEGGR